MIFFLSLGIFMNSIKFNITFHLLKLLTKYSILIYVEFCRCNIKN